MRFNWMLRRGLPEGLQYVAVPEFQKRGSLHYHGIFFNLPYLWHGRDRLRKLWPFGFQVDLRAVPNANQIGSYLAPYLSKQGADIRFWRKRRYFPSRQLKLPFRVDDEAIIQNLLLRMPNPVERRDYTGRFFSYSSFVLPCPFELFDFEKRVCYTKL